MNAFIQLYIASMKEFARDRMALFWTLAFPLFFIILFGSLFSGGGGVSFDVGVAVEDRGPVGQQIGAAFGQVGVFDVITGERQTLLDSFRRGDLDGVIVVPDGVSGAVTAGQTASVEVHYDPSNQSASQVMLTIAGEVVDGFEREMSGRPTLLAIKPVTATADNLRTIDFILPGILAMSLMQLGLFATAPALVQLRAQHILRRIGATPLPRTTLLASQVAHQLTIGLTQTLIITLVGVLAYNVQIVGNLGLLVGFVLAGACMFVAMGYLISGLAKTQESAIGLSQLINFPMLFLSGLFFPVETMPDWLRPIVQLMPLTYLADALRQLMVGANPLNSLEVNMAVLIGWLVVCTIGAVRLFKWE